VQTSQGFAITTTSVVSEEELQHFRGATRLTYPSVMLCNAALPTSFLKLADVPFTLNDHAISPEAVLSQIAKVGLKDHVVLQSPPRIVHTSPKSDTCSVYLNVADSVNGARAKALVGRTVQFGRWVSVFKEARANPGSPLCMKCWRWGHPSQACRAPQIKCSACSGPHRSEHHRTLLGCCRGNAKVTPPMPAMPEGQPCPHPAQCISCRKDHAADSRKCKFWAHRFDQEWIKARYDEVRERSRSRSLLHANCPAGRGGRPQC
jgi:hypothetical protein